MTQTQLWITAAVLWTAAFGLMIARGFHPDEDYWAEWGCLVGMIAAVTTLHASQVHERVRNETIARAVCRYQDLLEAEDKEKDAVRRLR